MPKIAQKKPSVFLCHASDDKPTVRVLYQHLKSDGYDVWFDEKNIMPGQDWKLESLKGLRNADFIIICLSSISVEKEGYVQVEIKKALEIAEEKPEGTILIIPLKMDDCVVPVSIEKWQWVNFYDEEGINKLKRGLKNGWKEKLKPTLIGREKEIVKSIESQKAERDSAIKDSPKTKLGYDSSKKTTRQNIETESELKFIKEKIEDGNKEEITLGRDKLFLKAADFSINRQWASEIPNDIVESFNESDPPVIFIGSGFGKEAIPPLKTGGELAKDLRNELSLHDNEDNLSELLQYLKNSRARSKRSVTEWLKKNLDHGNSEPGGAYRLLLELPCKIYLTTNYDSLLVDASRQMNRKLIVIDDPSSFESNYDDIKLKDKTGILGRLHGAFEFQENIVATTDDYIERYIGDKRWQELLENIFRNKRVIFIGYSLKDFTTWTSLISVFTKWHNSVYSHVLVSPNKSDHIRLFWNQYKIRYIPLKASQFLIAIHDQLGNLEKNEQVAISAVAACIGKTYDEAKMEVEIQKRQLFLPSRTMTAIKMIMDGCNEN